ncbi:MAG: hypothetical protein ACE5E6_04325 [Phycisphaerae bacterium]
MGVSTKSRRVGASFWMAGVVIAWPVGAVWAAGGFPTEGPDVIVGNLPSVQQFGRTGPIQEGTVGLSIGTTSCNKGNVPIHWFALPNTDHPTIAMNLYRLATVDGSDRLEQIGQSWVKHGFAALQMDACNFGCTPSDPNMLGVGCSDPYGVGLNADPCGLGPRAAVNPYTGDMQGGGNLGPGGGCTTNYPARNHIGHNHIPEGIPSIVHRLQVPDVDLVPSMNPDARYFAEGQYITRHEFIAGNGNQNNNVSYREFTVIGMSGQGVFFFGPVADTVREAPAVDAWSAATQAMIEPAPLVDGRAFLAYDVTDLGDGQWHYEYAVYNMNLDAGVGSISIPIPTGVTVDNIGFHAPLNHGPQPNTPTYSNTPWDAASDAGALTWSTDAFDTDPNANAVRFGTLYNFRFDADAPPEPADVTIGLFKTPESVVVAGVGPAGMEGLTIVSSDPPDNAIDARQPSDPDGANPAGWDGIVLTFDGDTAGLTSDDFTVVPDVPGMPPLPVTVTTDGNTATLQFGDPYPVFIPTGAWTVVTHLPSESSVRIGYLPADVNNDRLSNANDILALIDDLNGVSDPPRPDYQCDTDRSGACNANDVLRVIDLLNGAGAYDIWLGATLP